MAGSIRARSVAAAALALAALALATLAFAALAFLMLVRLMEGFDFRRRDPAVAIAVDLRELVGRLASRIPLGAGDRAVAIGIQLFDTAAAFTAFSFTALAFFADQLVTTAQ